MRPMPQILHDDGFLALLQSPAMFESVAEQDTNGEALRQVAKAPILSRSMVRTFSGPRGFNASTFVFRMPTSMFLIGR